MSILSHLPLCDHQRPLPAALYSHHVSRCLPWSTLKNSESCWKSFKQIKPHWSLKPTSRQVPRIHWMTSSKPLPEPQSWSLRQWMKCEQDGSSAKMLGYTDIHLLIAGTQRHTSTKSLSYQRNWLTWINTYLWFISVLMHAATFKHATFSNNNGLDKKTMNLTCYIDIKSEGLQNILKIVL